LGKGHHVGIDQTDHGDHQQTAALEYDRAYDAKESSPQGSVGHPVEPSLQSISCELLHPTAEKAHSKEKERQSAEDFKGLDHCSSPLVVCPSIKESHKLYLASIDVPCDQQLRGYCQFATDLQG
jgi:hypothetical protein